MNPKLLQKLSLLSPRERKALYEASTALYFDDGSDYVSALWGVVLALLEDEEFDEEDNIKLAQYLINA